MKPLWIKERLWDNQLGLCTVAPLESTAKMEAFAAGSGVKQPRVTRAYIGKMSSHSHFLSTFGSNWSTDKERFPMQQR